MAKTKRLNVKQVEAELRLIVLGANGLEVNERGFVPCIPKVISAIVIHWFAQNRTEVILGNLGRFENWESFASLAAFIVAERNRLDARGVA